eukprot:CAMPEP_0194381482 /NCGR_PEP_ID=MMETSP0174-20130528/53395_1 /TAXON_ID=216777 /ORGANISM="Proboscia alata, Strain PI-D3" /LENGTH=242 /DNA_ID=CAMNT_0039165869 /DNA_START=402 /DNA_END=1132 /DNA_ORIENTATION=+
MGAQLGREDLGDAKETLSRKTKEKRVRKIRKHPRYDEGLIENDVALLFFRSSFRGYDPVLLNTNNAVPSSGQNLTVAGWGATKIGGELNDKKLEAAVTVDEECGADLNITSDTFCATSSESGPCTGDSGGPIISKGTSSTTDVVLGVVSHGIGCKKNSNELYPGIYARVADPDILRGSEKKFAKGLEDHRVVSIVFRWQRMKNASISDKGAVHDEQMQGLEEKANAKEMLYVLQKVLVDTAY